MGLLKPSILAAALALCASASEQRLTPKPASGIPLDPAAAQWRTAPKVVVELMPQTIAPPGGGGAVRRVEVRALRSPDSIAFRLEWEDSTKSVDRTAAENFTDAVALEFPALAGRWPSPFMGGPDDPVAIWRWSAAGQADVDLGWQGREALRPRMAIDMYPFAKDLLYQGGVAAGNSVSTKGFRTPVEALFARGFGTLAAADTQDVVGQGVWRAGRWSVVISRRLGGEPAFGVGDSLPFAVAAWDGGAGERNGAKAVSLWHELVMGDPAPSPSDPVMRGLRIWNRYGCATCHGTAARGGISNPNSQVDPIPALNRIKEGFTKAEARAVILNGREPVRQDSKGPPPPFRMNAWATVMSPEEADEVIDYLFSLQPSGEVW